MRSAVVEAPTICAGWPTVPSTTHPRVCGVPGHEAQRRGRTKPTPSTGEILYRTRRRQNRVWLAVTAATVALARPLTAEDSAYICSWLGSPTMRFPRCREATTMSVPPVRHKVTPTARDGVSMIKGQHRDRLRQGDAGRHWRRVSRSGSLRRGSAG